MSRPERRENVHLTRGIVDVVVASNDVRDVHLEVVDNNGEIVGWGAIGSGDDEIVQLRIVEHHLASNQIIDNDIAFPRISESNNRVDTVPRCRSMAATAIISRLFTIRALRFAHCVKLVSGAVTVIGQFICQQRFDVDLVAVHALSLIVRSFIGGQPEPRQTIKDRVNRFLGRALSIGILNSKDVSATVPAGKQPAKQRSPRTSHMQITGRARRKSGSNFHAEIGSRIGRRVILTGVHQ